MNGLELKRFLNRLDELKVLLNEGKGTGGGNPYHDEKGRFTTGPSGKKEPIISEDAKAVFDEEDWLTDGAYKKDFNAIMDEFSSLGVDISKVKFETNIKKLPESMQAWIGRSKNIKGCAFSKKNLEALVYLDEDKQLDYGFGGDRKYLDGKDVKDQPFTTNNSPMGIVRHELGHIASYTLYMKSSGRKPTAGNLNVGAVRMDIHSRFKKIFGDYYSLNKLKLSRYGMTDSSEAVAEAFSNPNFSEDTRKIYDYYKKELAKKTAKNAVEKDEWVFLCDGYKESE